MRVLVVGAGPIGLEAALRADDAGHEVTVVESGHQVGANVRTWGHVRLFSPWNLEVSDRGREVVEGQGSRVPVAGEPPTGEEYCDAYLEPLAAYLADRVRFVFETDVVGITRGRAFKQQLIGDPARAALPFRVLMEGPEAEYVEEFDAVLDCSGVLDTPNFLGVGGLPAVGEANLDHRITRRIPDVADEDRDVFAGRTVLVVGDGMSAISTIDALLGLKDDVPATRIIWVTASAGDPYRRVPDDPLPDRDRLAVLGNELAAGDPRIERVASAGVERLEARGESLLVTVSDASGASRVLTVDEVVANVGYRPNLTIAEELQFHACWATQGPMKLASSLLASGATAVDCLAQEAVGPDLLRNPEARYYVLGAKSYGRNANFLIRTGIEQVEAVIAALAE